MELPRQIKQLLACVKRSRFFEDISDDAVRYFSKTQAWRYKKLPSLEKEGWTRFADGVVRSDKRSIVYAPKIPKSSHVEITY